jgi:hypothetical protein
VADETHVPDTSTPGLTVAWLDNYSSYGILHAPSRLAIAKGWARREDAIAVADFLDGMLPWAATAAKLQQAPPADVTAVAFAVGDGGGAFLVKADGGGRDA